MKKKIYKVSLQTFIFNVKATDEIRATIILAKYLIKPEHISKIYYTKNNCKELNKTMINLIDKNKIIDENSITY